LTGRSSKATLVSASILIVRKRRLLRTLRFVRDGRPRHDVRLVVPARDLRLVKHGAATACQLVETGPSAVGRRCWLLCHRLLRRGRL
jgi:hypothetical protein